MNEKYLWDRSGPPDPEIERLEQALQPLRYRHQAGVLQAKRPRPTAWWGAVAATLLAAVMLSRYTPGTPVTAWRVDSLEGQARMGRDAATVSMALRAGDLLRTERGTNLKLRADELGTIDVGPDSLLRAATNRQVRLERGTLHAYIWAPPRMFVVDTPSSRAVDLGCEYTLTVDPSGDGLLKVSMGWVAFQFRDQESFIPAGAVCVTRKRSGPGIPYYADAAEVIQKSLPALERGDSSVLPAVLAAARREDGLTLWHLLTRVQPRDRGAVFDRFAQVVPLPAEVTREAVLRKDAHALDLSWDALNLESTEWWRGWERRWESEH